MRILMIDDMPCRAQWLWARGLKHRDITVAHGLEQVNFYLENFKYDLILLDYDMPLANGREICEHCLIHRNIPVIIISNNKPGSGLMAAMLEDYAVPVRYLPITRLLSADCWYSGIWAQIRLEEVWSLA